MKKIFFLFALVGCVSLKAQYSNVPQPFPVNSITYNVPASNSWNTDVTNYGPIEASPSGSLTITPNANVTFTSAQEVELLPGFHAGPSGNSSFHAQIAGVADELALFIPANVTTPDLNVEQYEKLEYGVKLPGEVIDAINRKKGTNSTVGPILNPFDPSELSMTVTYSHYSSQNASSPDLIYQGFGFYYEDYVRQQGQNIPIVGWVPLTPSNQTEYRARFRWAPLRLGIWKVEISISTSIALSQPYSKHFALPPF